nr:NB-ARC domain-containing protein [Nonomuraea typhae]
MEAQSGLYRSLLDGRRMLIVLDNVNHARQIRPLLPASPSCQVVVTSRSRLSGLAAREGASRVSLNPLSAADATELLRQIIGTARVEEEPGAHAALAHRCVNLPLALRVAAERVAAHPQSRLADLVEELDVERNRLNVLATDDDETTVVRTVFSWSYRALQPETAQAFRLLGLHSGSDLDAQAAAALIGTTVTEAKRLLGLLSSVCLLEEGGRDRYRFHDLLRIYATELAEAEETETIRKDAILRLLSWYLHSTDAADRILMPQRRHVSLEPAHPDHPPRSFSTHGQALDWCEAELPNLIGAIRQAADLRFHEIAWKLPNALWSYFYLRKHWADQLAVLEIGVHAAELADDPNGKAENLVILGLALRDLHRTDQAISVLEESLAMVRACSASRKRSPATNKPSASPVRSTTAGEKPTHCTTPVTLTTAYGGSKRPSLITRKPSTSARTSTTGRAKHKPCTNSAHATSAWPGQRRHANSGTRPWLSSRTSAHLKQKRPAASSTGALLHDGAMDGGRRQRISAAHDQVLISKTQALGERNLM